MYRTRRFRVLGYHFAFQSNDEGLARYLDEMFDACLTPTGPTAWYSILPGHESKHTHLIYHDGRLVMSAGSAGFVPKFLTWDVNRRAIRATQATHVTLHAGVVARQGEALLLPADMEAGKTTLVAGLLKLGFEYLSDEAAPIDPSTYHVQPFPKPLSLDKGSWHLFPECKPLLPGTTDDYASDQWQVGPRAFGATAAPHGLPVRLVVFPRYVAGAATELRPIRPVEALIRLLKQTFGLRDQLERNLDTLGSLAERTQQFELTMGALDSACDLVEDVVGLTSRLAGSER